MVNGWIKLHRKMVDWEWFSEPLTAHLFIYILLAANHEDGRWKGKEIKKGQLITSREKLANDTGLTQQQVRTHLKKLELSGEIIKKSTSKFTLITVENYTKYQSQEPTDNQQITNKEPTDNQQITTNKKNKNNKNNKNVKNNKNNNPPIIPPRGACGESVTDIIKQVPFELESVLKEYKAYREKIKAPLTPNALKRLLKKANDLANGDTNTVKKLFLQSIDNGWRGIFPLKEDSQTRTVSFIDFLGDEK